MQTIEVQIDGHSLLKNIGQVFTSSKSFIRELMQNGRRAGATRIDIVAEKKSASGGVILSVQDNGKGIEDFQSLLTLAKSGWSEEVQEENPFGIGFFSALFAGTFVEVESGSKRIRMDTSKGLPTGVVPIEESEVVVQGTKVTIHQVNVSDFNPVYSYNDKGIDYEVFKISRVVEEEASAFEIEVTFNGESVIRHADEMFNSPDIIKMSIDGLGEVAFDLNAAAGGGISAFLIGAPILQSWSSGGETGIWVKLDPKIFKARMPDRDTLIDAAAKEKEIIALLVDPLYQLILDDISKLSAVDAAKKYMSLFMRVPKGFKKLARLVNHIDVLPRFVVWEHSMPPTKKSDELCDVLSNGLIVHRSQVESGEVKLAFDHPIYGGEDFSLCHVAYEEGYKVINYDLPEDHWAMKGILHLQDEHFCNQVSSTVKIEGEMARWDDENDVEVILCKSVSFEAFGKTYVPKYPALFGGDGNERVIVPIDEALSTTRFVARCIAPPFSDELGTYDKYCDLTAELEIKLSRARGLPFGEMMVKSLRESPSYHALPTGKALVCMAKGKLVSLTISDERLEAILSAAPGLFSEEELGLLRPTT